MGKKKNEREGGLFLRFLFPVSEIKIITKKKKSLSFPFLFPTWRVCVCVCLYGLIYKAYGVINHLFMRTGYTYIKEEENKMYTGKGKKKKIGSPLYIITFSCGYARCNYTMANTVHVSRPYNMGRVQAV